MLWQEDSGAFSYEKQQRTLLAAVWQHTCLPDSLEGLRGASGTAWELAGETGQEATRQGYHPSQLLGTWTPGGRENVGPTKLTKPSQGRQALHCVSG